MPARRKAAMLDRPMAPTDMPSEAALAVRSQELDEVVARLVACIPFHVLEETRQERIAEGGLMAGGRPSSLSPQVASLAIRAVCQGNYPTTACRAAGINDATWDRWQARAAEGAEPFVSFCGMMAQAAGYHEAKTIARIDAQGALSWRAGVALVERRYRDRWGAVQGPAPVSAPPVTVNVITMGDLAALGGLLGSDTAPLQIVDGTVIEGENP
jgi:hypothetical protein